MSTISARLGAVAGLMVSAASASAEIQLRDTSPPSHWRERRDGIKNLSRHGRTRINHPFARTS